MPYMAIISPTIDRRAYYDSEGRECTRCGEYKKYNKFYKRQYAKTGYDNVCKKCKVILKKEYRQGVDKNKNKEYLTAQVLAANARAKRYELPANMTVPEWVLILEYWNYSCYICGSSEKLCIEHIVPIVQEIHGTEIGNVAPACWGCNRKKSMNKLERFLSWEYSKDETEKILQKVNDFINWCTHTNQVNFG